MVALHVRGEPPDGQQPGGEMGVREAACQAQARLDERHRSVLLPLAQQDAGTDVQQVGEQVVVPGSPGDRQCLVAVFPGDRVAARLLKEVGRCGQGPGAQQCPPLGSRPVQNTRKEAASRMPGAGSAWCRL